MSRLVTRASQVLLLLAAIGAAARAQTIVTSPAPSAVDVTVYRDPGRAPQTPLNLRWLNGYALISETRQVSLPAGETELRFEGVAGGILPQSAIVSGLPEGIIERNRDAYLLSPATLLDRSLGRRVHLRRTSPTGEVREHEAVVRSGAGGAVVLETEQGFEALRCTGLAETIVYPSVPPGLSAKPTLSVRARSSRALTATVTLSYLASGFDWQADYVATLNPAGDRIQLFGWMTLANGDETGFVEADTQAVAGRLNRQYAPRQPSEGGPLQLQCWPQGTTSDIPEQRFERIVVMGSRIGGMPHPPPPPPPAPPPPPPPPAMEAAQEELGDVKLYRIPEPVTVAARSQKQVAFLTRPSVRVREIYRRHVWIYDQDYHVQADRLLVTRNRPAEGLGMPLPAGRLVLFGAGRERPVLLGEGHIADRAVGEEVEVIVASSPAVTSQLRTGARSMDGVDRELTVRNALPRPVDFEAEFERLAGQIVSPTRLDRRNGRGLWRVRIPANGTATLRFGYRLSPESEGASE